MSREKNLIKNTGILAIGQLSSKLFTFLLLPVYTSLLLPEDYGVVDVLQTVINLVLYVATLQIESAIFRFLIDNRDNTEIKKEYISTGLFIVVSMTGITTLIVLLVNRYYNVPYLSLFLLSLWALAFYFFLSNLARGLGKNTDYSIASFIVTLSSLIINIVFIVSLGKGASSILLALAGSQVFGSLYLVFRLKVWRLVSFHAFRKAKMQEMLAYSVPLIPNAISWWIANTSDRILILMFLGSAANGIYATANKIPTIYTTLFSVFNLAWSESVSLSMKDKDHQQYINAMLNRSYKFFSFLNLGIIICMSFMFDLLVGENYAQAYSQIYILLVAIFANSMCSLLGGVLTGLKDSKATGWTTAVGAAVNFLINLCLIQKIGLYAASISTLVSYCVIFLCRYKVVCKSIKVRFSLNYSVQLAIILALVSTAYFLRNIMLSMIVLFVLVVWGCWQNQETIRGFLLILQKKDNKNED